MLVHGLGRPAELAARACVLTGHQGAGAVVAQVVGEVAALQDVLAGVRVGAGHHQFVQEPVKKDRETYIGVNL